LRKGRVRLLRGYRVDAGAHTTTLRAPSGPASWLGYLVLSTLSDQLCDCGHAEPLLVELRCWSVPETSHADYQSYDKTPSNGKPAPARRLRTDHSLDRATAQLVFGVGQVVLGQGRLVVGGGPDVLDADRSALNVESAPPSSPSRLARSRSSSLTCARRAAVRRRACPDAVRAGCKYSSPEPAGMSLPMMMFSSARPGGRACPR